MSYREDIHKNLKESFGYDALDRLERIGYHVNANHQLYLDRYIEYDNGGIGNISSITGTGSGFNYGENGAGPHALTSVSRPEPGWRPGPQEIKYTAFNKASSIIDTVSIGRALSYDIHYGLDDQRHKSVFKDSGQVIRTKYYFGDYEKINENSETKNYHYISSPTGLCAIFVKDDQGGQVQLWHTYTDHLGSLVYMVNADNANDYKEYSYDAWGNPRDAEDWTQPATENLFAARGFTGHEHLEEFALINMNGRIYDPMLGRFFSPDPYVQLPGYAGSYNRYSYCFNNPLVYVDPDGEIAWFVPIIIGDVIGGTSGAIIGHSKGAKGLDMVGYIAGGALIGGLSGGAASGVSALGGAAWWAGAAAGAVAGAGFNGLATGWDGNAMLKGAAIGAIAGFVGGSIATTIGGPGGAFTGGIASDVTSQFLGTEDVNLGRSLLAGGVSFGMYHGFQYAQWKWGGGNRLGDFDITYKQFSKINSMYQRYQSWLGDKREGGLVLNIGGEGKNWGYMVDRADRFHDHVNFRNVNNRHILVHSHVNNSMTRAFPSHSTGVPNSDVVSLQGYHSLVVSPKGSSTMMGYQHWPNVLIQSSPCVRFFLFPWLGY